MNVISLDTETTGKDLKHGAMPFLVTTCNTEQENEWWEWDVNPLNRKVRYPKKDKRQIRDKIEAADVIVIHNSSFDVAALARIFDDLDEWWDWSKVFDTLYSCHLLASGQLKNLTTAAMVYLGVNIAPYEDAVEEVTKRIRSICKRKGSKYSDWMIAKEGLPGMPSAKDSSDKDEDKIWKYDMWLGRAYAKRENLPEDAVEWTACQDYANPDSSVTVALYEVHRKMIEERGLDKIFKERMKLPKIVYQMESKGITLNKRRLDILYNEFKEEYDFLKEKCVNIAKTYDYDLEMPKGSSSNNSLKEFIFEEMKMPVIKTTPKGQPAMDKNCMESYIAELDTPKLRRSKPYHFINSLLQLRQRGTALSYMDGYKRFWNKVGGKHSEEYILYPSVNPVGTNTLRWSSYSPNSQNISKRKIGVNDRNLRYAFGPSPGREWWSLDYDNLELRLPAFESGEPEMVKLFLQPDAPPYFGSYHLLVFDTLHPDKFAKYGTKVKDVYKDTWYTWTKNGNFAVQYGAMAESGTADRAYHVPGAQRTIEDRFTEIKKLSRYWIEHAQETGIVYTMPDKAVDPDKGYPLECERTKWGRVKPTVPLSYHIQGTACWVVMCAMIEVEEYLSSLRKTTGEDYYICMNVHDEIVLDFPYKPDQGNREYIEHIRSIMESMGDRINVPLTCGMDYHPENWSVAA